MAPPDTNFPHTLANLPRSPNCQVFFQMLRSSLFFPNLPERDKAPVVIALTMIYLVRLPLNSRCSFSIAMQTSWAYHVLRIFLKFSQDSLVFCLYVRSCTRLLLPLCPHNATQSHFKQQRNQDFCGDIRLRKACGNDCWKVRRSCASNNREIKTSAPHRTA